MPRPKRLDSRDSAVPIHTLDVAYECAGCGADIVAYHVAKSTIETGTSWTCICPDCGCENDIQVRLIVQGVED